MTGEKSPRTIREERGEIHELAYVQAEPERLLHTREIVGLERWAFDLGKLLTYYTTRAFRDGAHGHNASAFVNGVKDQLEELRQRPELMPQFLDGIRSSMIAAGLIRDTFPQRPDPSA
jgi:hypothetical protein